MSKRIEISKAVSNSDGNKSKPKEIQCIMFPEELHFWSKKNPWDKDKFKKKDISLSAVEVYSTAIISSSKDAGVHKVDRKNAIVLDCGVEIFDGSHGVTVQNNVARFDFRVSGVTEFNMAMRELSERFSFKIWSVTSAEVIYNKMGATLYFWRHNPNGIGTRLYLGRIVTKDFDKPWEAINIMDQQTFSNGFYDEFAACSLEWVPELKKSCAILKRKELKSFLQKNQLN